MTILIAVLVLVSVVLNGYMVCVMFGDFAGWMRKRHYNRTGNFDTIWVDLEMFFEKF